VLPHPFQLLNNHHAMNVTPKHYAWTDFYDQVIGLTAYTYSWRAVVNRYRANTGVIPSWMNVIRAISSEGSGRTQYYTEIRRRLDTDPQIQRYFRGDTTEIPQFYLDKVRRTLGPFYEYLPDGALDHDPNAYLKSTGASNQPVTVNRTSVGRSSTDMPMALRT
jgi:hypothetical protein